MHSKRRRGAVVRDTRLFGAVPVRHTNMFASEIPLKQLQMFGGFLPFYTVIATVQICLAKLIFLAGMFTLCNMLYYKDNRHYCYYDI